MPEATAAAAPPLEPPGVWSVFHGLRVGPHARGSVTGRLPSSGEFERPRLISPVSRNRATIVVSLVGDRSRLLECDVAARLGGAPVVGGEILQQERHPGEW